MAEGGSILGALWNWVTPRAAEAKITGGPDEQAMLEAAQRANVQGQGQYLPDMQQRIVAVARRHPQGVQLTEVPGLMGRTGNVAGYVGGPPEIMYDPQVGAQGRGNTMAHELLHFLNAHTAQLPVPAQHALIGKLLGTNLYQPPEALKGYQPGAFSPVEHSIINEWMGGPRDWPR